MFLVVVFVDLHVTMSRSLPVMRFVYVYFGQT